MALVLDQAISNHGSASFTGSSITFVLVHITTVGPDAFVRDLFAPDQMIKLGWFSLGSTTDAIDLVSRTYWNDPIWIQFTDFIWHPYPTNWQGNPPDFGVWADSIRWALSPETEANIYVWGAP